jgi:uncharacterized protein
MSDDAPGASTRATALTDRSERYGKQLVSHLGRRNGGQRSPETQSESIKLGSREATVSAKDGELRLRIVGAVDDLSQLEDVVGRHPVSFGERDELTVAIGLPRLPLIVSIFRAPMSPARS